MAAGLFNDTSLVLCSLISNIKSKGKYVASIILGCWEGEGGRKEIYLILANPAVFIP